MTNYFQDFFDSPAGAFGAQAFGTMGIGMLGMAMSLPNLGFQTSGTVPGGSVGANGGVGASGVDGGIGALGGGGLPTNTAIQTLALSLALVPLGLLAVAVFPPFARFVDYHTRAIINCS